MIPRQMRDDPRGPVIPANARRNCKRRFCQICGAEYGKIHTRYAFAVATKPWVPRENIDHIIPCRFVTRRNFGDPNAVVNLLSTCHRCNLGKKGAEDRLFASDMIGFVQKLQARGWGHELKRAAKFYGLLDLANMVRV